MTTKGQMKPTSRVVSTASQASENSRTNGLEHKIVSGIVGDLIFRRKLKKNTVVGTHHGSSKATEFE
jgi:hypothetical protein